MQRYKIEIIIETDADPSTLLDTAISELAPQIEGHVGERVTFDEGEISVEAVNDKPAQSRSMHIIRFSHRHGSDVWPTWRDEAPDEDEIIKELEAADLWDGDDECIEIYGPFEIPKGTK